MATERPAAAEGHCPSAASAGKPAAEATEIRQLTQRLARGDERAFDTFYARYADRLYRYMLVVARGDEGLVRDAMQECMVRVLRHVRPFEREEVLWGWLTVLARSALIDLLRRRQRIRRHESALRDVEQEALPPETGTDEALLQALRTALERLPEADRHCLERHYLDGVPQGTLADERGMSRKAVESRMARLRKKLRAIILDILSHE